MHSECKRKTERKNTSNNHKNHQAALFVKPDQAMKSYTPLAGTRNIFTSLKKCMAHFATAPFFRSQCARHLAFGQWKIFSYLKNEAERKDFPF
jgi:hypothetical protein